MRLQQAASSLLSNAVKYGAGWVALSTLRTDACVRIKVENTCAPIADERIEELFAPYAQGRERQPGVGLGLHIVREIARAHEATAYEHRSDGRIAFTMDRAL